MAIYNREIKVNVDYVNEELSIEESSIVTKLKNAKEKAIESSVSCKLFRVNTVFYKPSEKYHDISLDEPEPDKRTKIDWVFLWSEKIVTVDGVKIDYYYHTIRTLNTYSMDRSADSLRLFLEQVFGVGEFPYDYQQYILEIIPKMIGQDFTLSRDENNVIRAKIWNYVTFSKKYYKFENVRNTLEKWIDGFNALSKELHDKREEFYKREDENEFTKMDVSRRLQLILKEIQTTIKINK